MELELANLAAVVTGASRGLGAASAEQLALEGARVAVISRNTERLRATAERISAVAVPGDLATPEGAAEAVERAVQELGALDILVICTAPPQRGPFAALDDAAWTEAIDGTLLSAIAMVHAALPHLRRSANASIVIVLASSVRVPLPNLVTSNVLRPGLNGLIKTLAGELAPDIRINGAAPGRVHTEGADELDAVYGRGEGLSADRIRERFESLIPLRRYGEPSEFGRLVAFLASPGASYVTGQVVAADGGMVRSLP